MKMFIPLSKVDEEQRMVYGYASTYNLDSQGDIVSREALEKALPDYMRFANIREMHQLSAVGVAEEAEIDEKGLFLAARIVDDSAWEKVKARVYKGFSIGGKLLKKVGNTIQDLRLTEISLVDRPANPEAVLEYWKADGADAAQEQSDMSKEHETDPATETAKAATGAEPAAAVATEDPAATAVAVTATETVSKGMYELADFAHCLRAAISCAASAEWEKQAEGDNSPIPAAMREWVKQGFALLQAMTAEEVGEMSALLDGAAKADGTDGIEKRGARFSRKTKESLASIHKMMKECDKALADMGYDTAEEEPEDAEKSTVVVDLVKADAELSELLKAAGIEVADDAQTGAVLKGALTELATVRADLAKSAERVKELEAEPAAPKGALKAVAIDKADDTNDVSKAKDPEPITDPLQAIRKAQQNPNFIQLGGAQPIQR